jgi:plastocyanin
MVRLTVRAIALCALIGSLLVAGACGGDDEDEDGGAATPAETTVAATAAPTTDAGGGDGGEAEVIPVDITAQDFEFEADVTTVAPEAVIAVTFTNDGSAPHTVNFYSDEEYSEAIPAAESGQVSGGESVNFTFEALASGTMYYRCEVHPQQMQGGLAIE